uniref:Ribonuclease E n=1 Tax=Steinernema glaseri TaxID=37863 RepID=A0A1I7ZYY3_9BILA
MSTFGGNLPIKQEPEDDARTPNFRPADMTGAFILYAPKEEPLDENVPPPVIVHQSSAPSAETVQTKEKESSNRSGRKNNAPKQAPKQKRQRASKKVPKKPVKAASVPQHRQAPTKRNDNKRNIRKKPEASKKSDAPLTRARKSAIEADDEPVAFRTRSRTAKNKK